MIELFIVTFGDTFDVESDPANAGFEVSENGAGYTWGILGDGPSPRSSWVAMIDDWEFVLVSDRSRTFDYDDRISDT